MSDTEEFCKVCRAVVKDDPCPHCGADTRTIERELLP